MQTIQLDISKKSEIEVIEAKQDDVGRKFQAVILENGQPYFIPANAVISLWYSGAAGEGNYTQINGQFPFLVYENRVTVELIAQMLKLPGGGQMCLVLVDEHGKQLGLWNIPYYVEGIPGIDGEGAKDYFNAFTKMLQDIQVDESLTAAGRPADAKAVGDALKKLKVEDGVLSYTVEDDEQLDNLLIDLMSQMKKWSRSHCVIYVEGTGASIPYGIWMFTFTRADTYVQIDAISGGKTFRRTYRCSMLRNSSFETVAKIPGWTSDNPAVSHLTSEKTRFGRYSMMIWDTHVDRGCNITSDPVVVVPGVSYTATVYVCGTAACQLGLQFYDEQGLVIDQIFQSYNPYEDMWLPVTVTGVAPEGTVQAAVVLSTVTDALGTTYFDDAQLRATGMAGELLQNPSFDTIIQIDGWSSNSMKDTLLTNEWVRPGNGVCAMKLIDSTDTTGVQVVSDPVSVVAGEEYGVSVDMSGEGMCEIWLRYLDHMGAVLSQNYKLVIPKKDSWSHFQVSAIAPANAKETHVAFITDPSSTASIFVDNVYLAPKRELGNSETDNERFSVWLSQDKDSMSVGGVVESLEDLSQVVYATLTEMAPSTTVHVSLICDFTSITSSGSLTLYKAMGMDSIYQATAMLMTTNGDVLVGTTMDDSLEGNWQPIDWAWSNPPMESGVEYRTTERYMGKAVYRKLIYLGALPNKTGKYYSHGIAMTQVIRMDSFIRNGDTLPATFAANNHVVTIYCSREFIIIETSKDLSSQVAYAQVYYTKE